MDDFHLDSIGTGRSWDDAAAPWASLFCDDANTAPEFFAANRRKSYFEPEKKLMFAMLSDAIYCFQHYCGARKRPGKQLFGAAQRWIFYSQSDDFFSFENVCEHLGIEPDYIRKGLRRWRSNSLSDSPNRRCHSFVR